MTAPHDDPRVRRGMLRQLELRRTTLAAGARPLGWKLGLGTRAAMEQHGTSAPLVGFLTDRGILASGSELAIGAWAKPTVEPELAVHIAADVPPDADRATAAAAIGGLGPALEIVDITGGEVEEILAGDIFHRFVVLGPPTPCADLDPASLRGSIRHGGETQHVAAPLALVGEPADAVAHLAAHLAAFGETVRAGDVVITGSIVPALGLEAGDALHYELAPLGELALTFTA